MMYLQARGSRSKKENLYEVIADRIEGMILDNRLHPAATAKVALRITAGQIAQLESLIDKMVESESNYIARADYDLRFHRQIIEYAGNPLLTCVYKLVTDLLKPILEHGLLTEKSGHLDGIMWHKRIVDNLHQGDDKLAEANMRQHLEVSKVMCRE